MKGRIFVFVIAITCFMGCEEVINLDLKTAATQYVIEGNLTNQRGMAQVAISQTTDFKAFNTFRGVSGATVSLSGDKLEPTLLTETSKGIYTNPNLRGISGRNYHLTVKVNGKTFTADCEMPQIVPLDSIFAKEVKFLDDSEIFTYVRFTDPLGPGNYYRFKQYINGAYNKQISVEADDLFDGRLVNQSLRPRNFDEDKTLQVGDTVKIEFMTISQPIYKYWFSARNGATGGGNAASPINPVTNLMGGALGYFSAHTLQKRSFVIN